MTVGDAILWSATVGVIGLIAGGVTMNIKWLLLLLPAVILWSWLVVTYGRTSSARRSRIKEFIEDGELGT